MRGVTEHKGNWVNSGLRVVAEPPRSDEHGVSDSYEISLIDPASGCKDCAWLHILFQTGDASREGFNGITDESLLAVVCDRLRCMQSGPLQTAAKADALRHVEMALASLRRE